MSKKLTRFAVAGGLFSTLVSAVWIALAADPQLRITREPNGSVTLEWNSQTGLVYQIYWNSNVLEDIGAWQPLTNFTAAGTVSTLTDTGGLARPHPGLADRRFYALLYERRTNVTLVSSDVLSNTVWTVADSPFLITNDVRIRSGADLAIGSGVRILFGSAGRLAVEGALEAWGSPDRPVIFTSSKLFAQPGDWQGIRFNGTNASGVLSNAVLEYAVTGVTCSNASPNLTSCTIRRCSQYGVFLDRASPLIQNCVIERNTLDGIWCQNRSAPQILGNAVRGNARDGISLNGSTSSDQNNLPAIRGNGLYDNVRYALAAQSYFQPAVVAIEARSNWWGTAAPTDIPARIYDTFDAVASPWVDYGNWLVAEGGAPTVGRSVFATVTNSTVWRASESPIWVLGPLTIASNTAVSVEAGVTVKVLGNWRLDVFGSLAVGGTTNSPVTFTSGQAVPTRGNWLGVRFNDGSVDAACVWSNAVVEYAQRGIECFDASPTLAGCVTRESSQHGIYLERSSPLIQGGAMENNTQDGIYCTWLSSPQILGNRIRLNGSDGIELAGYASSNRNSLPMIQGNALEGNTSYALNANTYYLPANVVIDARSNWWGTSVGQLIGARIYDYQDTTASPYVDWGSWLGAAGGAPVLGRGAVGTITNNTVWQAGDSPVTVMGNLTVASNTLLSIEAGVEVQFMGNYRLDVNGALQTRGTPNSPVVFTSGDAFGLPGDWQGIRFLDSSSDEQCILSNAIVEFAQTGVTCSDASPTLTACWIVDNSQHGVYLSRSSPKIQGMTIQYNFQDGIHCISNSSPAVIGNWIQGNGSDGIELEGISSSDRNNLPVIKGNALDGNVQFALRAISYFRPAEIIIEARSNWWGSATSAGITGAIFDYLDTTASPWVDWGNWQLAQGGVATEGRSVVGNLTNSTVWRASESPIWMLGPVTIGSNTAVSVEAGVSVKVLGNWRLDVFGSLAVAGTTSNPVMFTSGQPVPARGNWLGVRFNDSSVDAACVWSNAVVEYALRGIECYDASPTLVDCVTRENSQHGIYLERSSPLIQGGAMENNTLDGVQCAWLSSPQILGNRIRFNGSDGIELVGFASSNRNSMPVIQGNILERNTNFAVNANNYFQPSATTINARSNWWGTAEGSLIPPRIFDILDSSASPWVDWGNWLGNETGPAAPGLYVFGTITSNTLWRASDQHIGVIGPVTVSTNAVLSIEAGVPVDFLVTNRFDVAGGLQALGEWNNPVLFTSGRIAPTNGDWEGIRFLASSTNQPCVLSNVVVEYANIGLNCVQTSPTFAGCHIRRNNTGVFLDTSAATVVSNLVEFNGTGVYCYDNSRPILQGNTIVLNANNGVNVTPSTAGSDRNPLPILLGNSFIFNSTAGSSWYNLFAGAFFQPSSNTISAVSNWWSGATDTNLVEAGVYHRRDSASSPTVDFRSPLGLNPNFAIMGNANSLSWFSPNGDGVQDTLAIQATLSHNARWQVAILNSSNQIVTNFSGEGTDISCSWNGTNQMGGLAPEGRYRAVAFATNLQWAATAYSFGDYVRVDRTPPQSSAVVPALPDGTVAYTLTVQGSADDLGFAYYLVDYGSGPNPASFTLLSSNRIVSSSVLAQMNSKSLPNGTYLFRVRSFDLAGNVTTNSLLVVIDNLVIVNPEAASTFFDPGVGEGTVSFTITRPADVTFCICPVAATINVLGDVSATIQTNSPLRAFNLRLPGGPHTINWDGRDAAGQPVTNGLYAFVVSAVSDYGRSDVYNPSYVSGPVTLSNFGYSTNFTFYANEPCAVSYSLLTPAFVVLAVQNRPYVVVWGEPRTAGTHTEYWNGRSNADRSLLYGAFTLALKPQVLPENALVVDRPLNQLVTALQTESYLITPTFSEVSEIRFSLSSLAEVAVQVREPNGNVITVLSETTRAGGSHLVEWNGNTAAYQVVNVEGDYEVILRATDPASGLTETRTANVRIRK